MREIVGSGVCILYRAKGDLGAPGFWCVECWGGVSSGNYLPLRRKSGEYLFYPPSAVCVKGFPWMTAARLARFVTRSDFVYSDRTPKPCARWSLFLVGLKYNNGRSSSHSKPIRRSRRQCSKPSSAHLSSCFWCTVKTELFGTCLLYTSPSPRD